MSFSEGQLSLEMDVTKILNLSQTAGCAVADQGLSAIDGTALSYAILGVQRTSTVICTMI